MVWFLCLDWNSIVGCLGSFNCGQEMPNFVVLKELLKKFLIAILILSPLILLKMSGHGSFNLGYPTEKINHPKMTESSSIQ